MPCKCVFQSLDHRRWPTGVDLKPVEFRILTQYRLVHKTGFTLPSICGLGFGQYRGITEIRVYIEPAADFIVEI